MTKPSYEEAELKKLAEKARDFVPEPLKCLHCGKVMSQSTGPMASGAIWMDRCNDGQSGHTYSFSLGPSDNPATQFAAAANPQAILDLLDSLARVRGLLQRQYDLVRDEILVRNTVHDSNFTTYTKQAFRLTATLRETELALAESADIGKLDSADKKEYRGLFASAKLGDIKVTGTEEAVKWAIAALSSAYRLGRNERLAAAHNSANVAGSAETGGEKAAGDSIELANKICWEIYGDESLSAITIIADTIDYIERRPNFPRSSQNQTVASGVEGAHEGTTADESGSREPEKLNNAQNYPVFFPQPGGLSEWVTSDGKSWSNGEAAKKHEVALAESSLSSPPPRCQNWSYVWRCTKPSGHEGECTYGIK